MAKLPTVVSSLPQDLKAFLNQVREALDGRNGDRLVTVNDLFNSGVAAPGPGNTLLPPPGPVGAPITPTNVQASGAIQNIIVTWDDPLYNGHSHAEIWSSSTDNLGEAVQVGMAPGAIFVDSVGPSVDRYYWVRFVNVLGVQGAFNAVAGVLGQTGSDVAYLLETLTGQITESQLFNDLAARIDLIDGPASVTGTIPNQLALIQGQLDDINSYPEYDNGTTYDADDIVKYDGGLYKALSSTTGNLPTNTTYWLKIGDYSSLADIVAVHSKDISLLNTGLSGEVTARETLATQMRGSYGGTDLASVTSGLIFSERTARADADVGLAGSISVVAATAAGKNRIYRQPTAPSTPTLNDIWVDTKISYNPDYFSEEYSAPRFKQFQWNGTQWLDITDTDISDNFAFITREQTARATADSALAQDILTLAAKVDGNTAAIVVESTTRATADTALASQITTLQATVGDNTAAIQTEVTARTTADTALASQITTLQATVGDNTAAIQTEATVRADETGSLFAKYTVKVDVNGYVSGFGLASTANNSAPFSEFAIRADRFYVASPSGPGITPIIPFIVNTTPQVVNGVDVPVGIYMDAAFIKNGTITNAKIGNAVIDDAKIVSLTAAKITAGEISVGNYIQSTGFITGSQGWRIHGNGVAEFAAAAIRGQLTAAQIDSRGLTIRTAAGAVILNAGSSEFVGNVAGTVAGTAASTVVSTANTALSTANTAQGTANTALSTANTANSTANSALSGLTTKLNSNAQNVLAGAGGLSVGNLTWNSAGVRTGGYGVGFSANGLAAYNSAGAATFVLDGSTGNATFAGALSAATGSFAGSLSAATGTFSGTLTADAINAVKTINIAGENVTIPRSATGVYSAIVSFFNEVASNYIVIGTFTQGAGRGGVSVNLKAQYGSTVYSLGQENPIAGTTGAMSNNIFLPAGLVSFFVDTASNVGDMRCTVTVIGAMR
jgi:predicted phage tail protein